MPTAREGAGRHPCSGAVPGARLDLAEPEGIILPFALRAGPGAPGGSPAAQDRARPLLLSEILDVLAGSSARARRAGTSCREDLSEAELRVLRFLPSSLKAPEIAAELFVSPNTVRTHLRHVYSKLDAHSRARPSIGHGSLGWSRPGGARRPGRLTRASHTNGPASRRGSLTRSARAGSRTPVAGPARPPRRRCRHVPSRRHRPRARSALMPARRMPPLGRRVEDDDPEPAAVQRWAGAAPHWASWPVGIVRDKHHRGMRVLNAQIVHQVEAGHLPAWTENRARGLHQRVELRIAISRFRTASP